MSVFDIATASVSECGTRAVNEDALRIGRHDACCYAVLSDGAGGHTGGAEASRRVVERIDAALRAPAATFVPATLTRTLECVHEELQDEQAGAEGRQRMHATVVVLWLDGRTDHAIWSHVGDSRLYRLRYGTVDRVTADDSVVQRLLESGALTAAQAECHPLKNQLLAAVGMEERVEPHTLQAAVALEDGDAFLLCTDGWWGALDEVRMLATLRDSETPQAWLDAMHALIEARRLPDQDNYSAIAVWVSDPAECTHPMPDADWTVPAPLGLG
jgi:serine/threonine protein phosphatase PrpC